MTFRSRWLMTAMMAGTLTTACGGDGGLGPIIALVDAGNDLAPTDAAPMGDATADRADVRTDARADVRTDTQPVDHPVTMSDACTMAMDISAMTPGSDGAIHVMGNNEEGAPDQLGNLPMTCLASGGMKSTVVAYTYTMHAAGLLRVSTNNPGTSDDAFDTVIAVLPACTATAAPLACNDDVNTAGHMYHSTATTTMLTAGQHVTIVVGGWNDSTGDFELTVQEVAPAPMVNVGDPCGAAGICMANALCPNFIAAPATTPTDAGTPPDASTDAGPADVAAIDAAPADAAPADATPPADVAPPADAGAPVRRCVAPTAEVEPNNTPATAQGPVTSSAYYRAALTAGDTDCFSVTVPAGATLYGETSDGAGACSLMGGGDTILTVYQNAGATAVAMNDDIAMTDLCSRIDGRTTASLTRVAAGTYQFCVTGFAGGDAGSAPIMQYNLTIGVIAP